MAKITVIGTGTMGSGIAQAVLSAGHEVTLIAHSQKSVQDAASRVGAGFDKAVSAKAITQEQKSAMLSRLSVSADIASAYGSDFIIEAVSENFDTKEGVLKSAEKYLGSGILATNTSSIPITQLAAGLSRKDVFIGIHFFNPVPVMKVVELINGEATSPGTISRSFEFVSKLGKTPVVVKDSPGFIANRLLMLFINEAARALDHGVATKEGIDTIAKLGLHHPMGPFELADFIGIDVCNDIMLEIFRRTNDKVFEPAESIKKLVKEGSLGRKSGKGFYDYAARV